MNEDTPLKLLIVEDEFDIRELLRDTLSDCGWDISFATDGEEALQAVKEVMPDVVFLDIVMPKRQGWDVCADIKKNAATRHIKVVMLSALVQSSHKRKAFQMGADAYLTKPFRPTEIVALAEELMGVSSSRVG